MPENDRLRRVLLMELRRGKVSRRIATELFERTGDAELGHLLAFFYDRVASAELGDEELTYDLSVPDNVTYVANGFVSHNTIGLMMDCDTTGIEPDLGLCKTKKLVGGGHDVDRQPDGAPCPAPARLQRLTRSTTSSPTSTSTSPSSVRPTFWPTIWRCSPAPWATTSSITWVT